MNYEYITWHSHILGRDLHAGVYGQGGRVMLAFAPQDGKTQEFADFGMVEQLSPWIDQNRLMVVTPESIDEESWSDKNGDPGHRAYMQEQWFQAITQEFVPFIKAKTGTDEKLFATGCSMGGTHAANFFLRRPDLCGGVIALSGCYDASFFFDGYMDGNVYQNSPVHYMRNLPADHPYIQMFSESPAVICIGQGDWEWDLLPGNRELAAICAEKGIQIDFDFWGHDVAHDWSWWKKQIVYFMPRLIGEA